VKAKHKISQRRSSIPRLKKQQLNIYLDDDVVADLKAAAERTHRTQQSLMREGLKWVLDHYRNWKPPEHRPKRMKGNYRLKGQSRPW
jgi:uncharacterized protein YaeQ